MYQCCSRCGLLTREGEQFCWRHGGATRSPEERERSRVSTQRLKLRNQDIRLRRAYEMANESMDALARHRKISRWMMNEGGAEAFAAWDMSRRHDLHKYVTTGMKPCIVPQRHTCASRKVEGHEDKTHL